jgi:hypothetical protein
MYFKLQKLTSQNLVNQAAVFCVRNALKVIYEHLRFEKFSGGYTPGPPLKGREEREDGRGKEGIRDTGGEEGVVWDREREEGMRIIQRKGMGREEKGRGRKEGKR